MTIADTILASLPFGTLSSLVVAVGLALIGLAFTVALLSKAKDMASGARELADDDDDEVQKSKKDDD